MEISSLIPNHSDWYHVIITSDNINKVKNELLDWLKNEFDRAEKFSCSSFARIFKSAKEFKAWKKAKWDPVKDERCKLEVQKEESGICVEGDYDIPFADWSSDEVQIEIFDNELHLKVYTAGCGIKEICERFGTAYCTCVIEGVGISTNSLSNIFENNKEKGAEDDWIL